MLADLLQPAYRSLRVAYLHCYGQLLAAPADWQLLEACIFCLRCSSACILQHPSNTICHTLQEVSCA